MIEALVFAAGIFVSAFSGMGIMRHALDRSDFGIEGSAPPSLGVAKRRAGDKVLSEVTEATGTAISTHDDDWATTADWVAAASRRDNGQGVLR